MAKEAGLVGRRRVLDATALYDAVATQDTVTMVRSAIRALLSLADQALASQVRTALTRDDDYQSGGKPTCDWDDAAAREQLVDALARDGYAALAVLDGRALQDDIGAAAALLATVMGQDLEKRDDGVFRIARRVAPDRVISTADPEARHGHKTAARGFDGYKGHIAVDPDSEIITATEVTAGNAGDARVAEVLLRDVLTPPKADAPAEPTPPPKAAEVYGDASYGTAELVEKVEAAGVEANMKVQPPSPPRVGMFSQDDFAIDTEARTVRCPRGILVVLRTREDGSAVADFAAHCDGCPMRARCTQSKEGRSVRMHPKHEVLDRARKRQRDPEWRALSSDAAEGRAQDRSPDATQARRAARSRPRTTPGRARLRPAGRRDQPCSVGHPGLSGHVSVSSTGTNTPPSHNLPHPLSPLRLRSEVARRRRCPGRLVSEANEGRGSAHKTRHDGGWCFTPAS